MSSSYVHPDGTRGMIRKRKDPEPYDPQLSQIPVKQTFLKPAQPIKPSQVVRPAQQPNNKLLAGYLANEFLTKGTILGKRFEPSRSEPTTVQAGSSKPGNSYAEISYLMKSEGVQIPGVVNPAQLAKWLQR
ncbi:hypothetical protein LUZ60_016301 [Juncus effusus]|nr:hypothetical protein LUZ60_016301 [Juncus effusus]